ncbi:MAG: SDR family NAD(P)-dependent oxidoreductase [Pseudomonadota bacterium]
MTEDLAGRVILISGATGGFGEVAAKSLAASGARLVLTDLDPDGLEWLATSLDTDCATLSGDVTDPELAKHCLGLAIERFGQLDGAFNNAGIEHPVVRQPEIDRPTFDKIIAVNLLGVHAAMQAQLPYFYTRFKETGETGSILNTASIAGVAGAPKLSVYSAAKHGVVGLSRSAALEYAGRGVRVNCLCPCFFKTPMVMNSIIKGFPSEAEGLRAMASGIPMGRIGEPEEIVPAVHFALSPANSFFTGQEIRLDGGMTS